jgi:enamine deaminase RidA (YjgF/YER057c/UK114 family)
VEASLDPHADTRSERAEQLQIREIGSGRWDGLINSHFADANVTSELVFVSGQLALDDDGQLVGIGDVVAQAEQVFTNIAAILAEAGCELDDVVDVKVYLMDINDISRIAEARRRFFGDRRPASTALQIGGLVMPEALIEVSAIACRRGPHE